MSGWRSLRQILPHGRAADSGGLAGKHAKFVFHSLPKRDGMFVWEMVASIHEIAVERLELNRDQLAAAQVELEQITLNGQVLSQLLHELFK